MEARRERSERPHRRAVQSERIQDVREAPDMPLFGLRYFIADSLGLSTEAEKRTREKPLVDGSLDQTT